ncbi:HADHB [Cordylochernes scorpioides]|uniref:HADHB n=1 Tax=Cordylochernes scorpioides TaxID=51811 RepID=A0ABY6K8V9_9ARAC|nr:HADHB [Cordylochernes scorpioides]
MSFLTKTCLTASKVSYSKLGGYLALQTAKASTAAPSRQSKRNNGISNVVLVDAVRTPFVHSGTVYNNLMAVDLLSTAYS